MAEFTDELRDKVVGCMDFDDPGEADEDWEDGTGLVVLGWNTVRAAVSRVPSGTSLDVSDEEVEHLGSFYSRGAVRTPDYEPTDVEIVACVLDFYGLT